MNSTRTGSGKKNLKTIEKNIKNYRGRESGLCVLSVSVNNGEIRQTANYNN